VNGEGPQCDPLRGATPEVCNGIDDDCDGATDEGDAPLGPDRHTAFRDQVNAAIDLGLQYIRTVERGAGLFGDNRHNFLAVLAFLEKRERADGRGPPRGYAALTPEDRAMLGRLVAQSINGEPSMTNPNQQPYVYVTGGNLMALSLFRATGGPDEVGAAASVSQAIANGVASLTRAQGMQAPSNLGGWNYNAPENSGDLSTTHLAMNGLAAAAPFAPEADAALVRAVDFLQVSQNGNGGMGYRPNNDSSSSMTAAGLWLYRLARVPADDVRVQHGLQWVQQNYFYDRMVGPFTPTSTFYYFWALSKTMAAVPGDGGADGLGAADFGARDPAALGFADEPRSVWFDLAYTLLQWQNPQTGQIGNFGGAPGGWSDMSSHAFGLLTLERALGGVNQGVCHGL
jgi:hypothetical protein